MVRFEDAHHVEIDNTRYCADRFVVCSGSAALLPDIPGLADAGVITSTEALELEALPRSVVIVGGGIIAREFASLWTAFGVQVTIVGRRLLGNEDAEVGETLAEAFTRRGIGLVRGRAERVERRSDQRGGHCAATMDRPRSARTCYCSLPGVARCATD